MLLALEAADASAATAKVNIHALEQALSEANRRLTGAGQQEVHSAAYVIAQSGSSSTYTKVREVALVAVGDISLVLQVVEHVIKPQIWRLHNPLKKEKP